MILYNVTLVVESDIHEDWLRWMTEIHIPEVLATGQFISGRLCRILDQEEGGMSYAVQYTSPDMASFERYREVFAPGLQKEHALRYGNKFAAFRTLLEIVSEQNVGGN